MNGSSVAPPLADRVLGDQPSSFSWNYKSSIIQSLNFSILQSLRGAFGKDTSRSRSAEATSGRAPSPCDVACYCGGDYSASAGGHDRGWVE